MPPEQPKRATSKTFPLQQLSRGMFIAVPFIPIPQHFSSSPSLKMSPPQQKWLDLSKVVEMQQPDLNLLNFAPLQHLNSPSGSCIQFWRGILFRYKIFYNLFISFPLSLLEDKKIACQPRSQIFIATADSWWFGLYLSVAALLFILIYHNAVTTRLFSVKVLFSVAAFWTARSMCDSKCKELNKSHK